MWILVFPVDTVKSRLQGSTEKTSVGKVIRDVYAKGGIKGFFPGVGPAMLRSFPANAATFVGLELTYKAWDKVF
jgi:solute carrier family 25 carnitine/acylcarnitine transporter 20/29